MRVSTHNADVQKRSSKARSLALEDEDWTWTANKKTAPIGGSSLTRSGSVTNLIYRFDEPPTPPQRLGSLKIKQQDTSAQDSGKMRHESRERGKNRNPVSSEPSEPKTQESSEQKRHGAEKKKSDEKQTSQHSKDKAAVADPGPVSV